MLSCKLFSGKKNTIFFIEQDKFHEVNKKNQYFLDKAISHLLIQKIKKINNEYLTNKEKLEYMNIMSELNKNHAAKELIENELQVYINNLKYACELYRKDFNTKYQNFDPNYAQSNYCKIGKNFTTFICPGKNEQAIGIASEARALMRTRNALFVGKNKNENKFEYSLRILANTTISLGEKHDNNHKADFKILYHPSNVISNFLTKILTRLINAFSQSKKETKTKYHAPIFSLFASGRSYFTKQMIAVRKMSSLTVSK